jgi:hypothetical protein
MNQSLDVFTSLFGLALKIVGAHDVQKQLLFDKHVDPLYQSLTLVHEDYMRMLRELRVVVRDRQVLQSELLDFLSSRQIDLAAVRTLVDIKAGMLPSSPARPVLPQYWWLLQDFANAVKAYFEAASTAGSVTHYRAFIEHVRLNMQNGVKDPWRYPITGGPDHARQELENILTIMERDLPLRYRNVTELYTKLDIALN